MNIEIQGEQREKIADVLRKPGYKVKIAGGWPMEFWSASRYKLIIVYSGYHSIQSPLGWTQTESAASAVKRWLNPARKSSSP